MRMMLSSLLPLLAVMIQVRCDTNLLTGANDILVARGEDGDLYATPFSVQFGKKDIWLPRSGHTVSLKLNGEMVPLSMTLDSKGHGYFSTTEAVQTKYRFWSALLGVSDPLPHQMTDSATPAQLERLNLQKGHNSIEFQVITSSNSIITTKATLFYLNSTQKFVVSDIDGTITRSDVRGFILPALGLSDWKHEGVVELYRKISEQGYMMIYLSSRAIGQSQTTRDYLYSLREKGYSLPGGPLLLHVDSVINAFTTEVIDGNPEVQKIAKLARIRGIFRDGANPLYAAYGNRDTDIAAYRALSIPEDRIFRVNEESLLVSEGSSQPQTYKLHISELEQIYPPY